MTLGIYRRNVLQFTGSRKPRPDKQCVTPHSIEQRRGPLAPAGPIIVGFIHNHREAFSEGSAAQGIILLLPAALSRRSSGGGGGLREAVAGQDEEEPEEDGLDEEEKAAEGVVGGALTDVFEERYDAAAGAGC